MNTYPEPLVMYETENTPYIHLDKEQEIFKIGGKALPENTQVFFAPVFQWVDQYIENPNNKTEVAFSFEYLNSSSLKNILILIKKFDQLHKEGYDVVIHWNYLEEDEDMYEEGLGFSEEVDVPFEFHEFHDFPKN